MKQKMEWIVEQAQFVVDTVNELWDASGWGDEAVDHLAAILQIRERVAACLELAADPSEDERRRLAATRAAERNMLEAWRRLAWAGEACVRCSMYYAAEHGDAGSYACYGDILDLVEELAKIPRDADAATHEQACIEIVRYLNVAQ